MSDTRITIYVGCVLFRQSSDGRARLLVRSIQDYVAARQWQLLVRIDVVRRIFVVVPLVGGTLPASEVRAVRHLHRRRLEGRLLHRGTLLHLQETSRYEPIQYDTKCCFDMRSEADSVSLIYRTASVQSDHLLHGYMLPVFFATD